MSDDKQRVINIKLDDETKSKFETIAFIKRCTLQNLCIELINECIDKNKDIISEIESKRV